MADKSDHRHYPIPPLTETWSKTIEYKSLPNVKYNKCIMLSFDYEKLEKNLKNVFGENITMKFIVMNMILSTHSII